MAADLDSLAVLWKVVEDSRASGIDACSDLHWLGETPSAAKIVHSQYIDSYMKIQ